MIWKLAHVDSRARASKIYIALARWIKSFWIEPTWRLRSSLEFALYKKT